MRYKNPNLPGLATAALTSLWLPFAVTAQEGAPEKPSTSLGKITVTETEEIPYTVGESASATKLPLTLRETPQSVTVITRDRLDDQKMQSLRDVLDFTSGVYSYQYDTERVIFSARGFTIDNLLYDGVPAITNVSTDSVDDTLDTALYERIEIVRGATGLMTGAGSPAASVNLVRKRATSDSLAVQFDATAGSWDDRRFEADVSTPLNSSGTVRARGVAVYQERESYQNLYDLEKTVFYGVIDADLTPNTRASIGFDYLDNDPRSNTWGSFPMFLSNSEPTDWPRSVTTSTDWAFWNRRTKTVFGELSHAFGNGWAVRSTLSWRRFDENMALFYMFGFPDPQTGEGLLPFAYRSQTDNEETSLDVHASGPFELFGRKHELVIGYNGQRADYAGVEYAPDQDSYASTGNFFEWDGSFPEPDYFPSALLEDTDTRQNGLYTAARFTITDPLKVLAGVRFATFDTRHFNLYDNPGGEPFDYEHNKTLPYAGVIFDVSRDFSAFASYTGIFKPQNDRDENNRFLDPVEGESFEVGLKGEHFGGRLNTSLTVFETKQDNVAAPLRDPLTGVVVQLPDGTDASTTIDGTTTHGFELEASGELREGWNASLSWSKYSLEDAEGADVRSFSPRTLIRGFTTYRLPALQGRLTIGGGVNFQSDSHTRVAAPPGNITTDLREGDVTLLSLMARYRVTDNVSVQFNGENLLDKKYFVLDEYDNTYYGAPLNVSASFRWTF
jgi:outer membrane receptor for ferric coprogen and ferric-rhodotorulic acid